jgi:hypothetical protein
MTAKEYLSQAKYLDARINSKIRQVGALNDLATNATSALSGMPRNPNHGRSTMADCVAKIVDLQTEINADIDELVDLKREITRTIKALTDTEYQTILERRYLVFDSWEKIAAGMGYDLRYLLKLHGKALEAVQVILSRNGDNAERGH